VKNAASTGTVRLAALAHHPNLAQPEIDIGEQQPAHLPQPTQQHQQRHRPVPCRCQVGDEVRDFARIQRLRRPLRRPHLPARATGAPPQPQMTEHAALNRPHPGRAPRSREPDSACTTRRPRRTRTSRAPPRSAGSPSPQPRQRGSKASPPQTIAPNPWVAVANPDNRTHPSRPHPPAAALARTGTARSSPNRTRTPAAWPARNPEHSNHTYAS
jgi:hypothetical protein